MSSNWTSIARALADTTEQVSGGALPEHEEKNISLRKMFIRTWIKRVKADNDITSNQLSKIMGCSLGYINSELMNIDSGSPKVDTFVGYAKKVSRLPVYKPNREKYVRQICQQYFDAMMQDSLRDDYADTIS